MVWVARPLAVVAGDVVSSRGQRSGRGDEPGNFRSLAELPQEDAEGEGGG